MAFIVHYLHQIIDIDDIFLMHLDEIRGQLQQYLVGRIAFQSDRNFFIGHDNFPYADVMIVSEQTDVADVRESEIYTIGIDKQFVASYSVRILNGCIFCVIVIDTF